MVDLNKPLEFLAFGTTRLPCRVMRELKTEGEFKIVVAVDHGKYEMFSVLVEREFPYYLRNVEAIEDR